MWHIKLAAECIIIKKDNVYLVIGHYCYVSVAVVTGWTGGDAECAKTSQRCDAFVNVGRIRCEYTATSRYLD